MSNNKVSVIVPFFNTDIRYYKKCQESLCRQSYGNLEIIVVDDGSHGKYVGLLDDISRKDTRIKVFHKENGGVSSARNLGIKEATGTYIAFVDSDDWVEPTFIETLVHILEDNNAEISSVGIIEEYNGDARKTVDDKYRINILSKSDMYEALLTNSANIQGYLCNKLFKKELITQPLNEQYHYCEDLVFNAHYLEWVNIGVASTARLYHYRLGQGNATGNSRYDSKILTLISAYREVEEIYRTECPKKMEFIRYAILKQALNIRARYKMCNINNQAQYQYLQNIIQKYWDGYVTATFIQKLNIRMTLAFPKLLFKLKHLILNLKH